MGSKNSLPSLPGHPTAQTGTHHTNIEHRKTIEFDSGILAHPKNIFDLSDSANALSDWTSPEKKMSKLIETVFEWPYGGTTVFLAGQFNNWDKDATPLSNQGNGLFSITLPLEKGDYLYKFVVDGRWTEDKNKKTTQDVSGHINNIITVINLQRTIEEKKGRETYNQEIPSEDAFGEGKVPILPTHFTKHILNYQTDFEDNENSAEKPLPPPSHVTVYLYIYNIYRQHFGYEEKAIENGIAMISNTERIKTKFVTTVYYVPINPNCKDQLDNQIESASFQL